MKEKKKIKGKLEILTPQGLESGDKPRKMLMKKKKSACVLCGECCRGGGPVLMKGDMELFLSGVLSHDTTYTVREGELIRTQGDGEVFEAPLELIKIKGKAGSPECVFYRAKGQCAIYENRPSQCRAYKCWAPEDVLTGLEKERMVRKHIFGSVDLLLEAMGKHEEKCSYQKLAEAFEKVAQGSEEAVEDILDMLQYDTYIRPFLQEKYSVPESALDLLLGRPLADTIQAFGFKVERSGDEYVLAAIEEKKEGQK